MNLMTRYFIFTLSVYLYYGIGNFLILDDQKFSQSFIFYLLQEYGNRLLKLSGFVRPLSSSRLLKRELLSHYQGD